MTAFIIIFLTLAFIVICLSVYCAYKSGYEEGCATITAMYHKEIAELEKELAELRNQNTGEAEKDFTDCKECDCYVECFADGKFVGSYYSSEETERDKK